jgi:hypothetical protein
MKIIQVHRKKYLSASVHVYDVVVNYFNGIEERYPIKNNETITINLKDQNCYLSIWYHSFGYRTRLMLCEAFLIKAEDRDKSLIFKRSGKGLNTKMVLIENSLVEQPK